MKRPILSVYDYGQRGVWLLIDASSPSEVERRYPMLTAFADRPDWMTETEKADFIARCERDGLHWDIDLPPTGLLKGIIEESK